MASSEQPVSGAMTGDDRGSSDSSGIPPMMNGVGTKDSPKYVDDKMEVESLPSPGALMGSTDDSGGKEEDTSHVQKSTGNNLQTGKEGVDMNNNPQLQQQPFEKSQLNNNKVDDERGDSLEVIDGPLASNKGGENNSIGGTALSHNTPSVTDDVTHSRNSSMSSSLGELIGESAALLENGTATSTTPLTTTVHSTRSEMDIVSTENAGEEKIHHQQTSTDAMDIHQERPSGHVASKSTPDMMGAMSAVTTEGGGGGDKPQTLGLKHSVSSPPENASSAIRRGRSPQRPPTTSSSTSNNRERVNSSQDITSEALEQTDDDDDDEDENDIPPHIQSKIVEKSPAERYIRFKEKLGSGAYKDVYRAYDTIEGIEVAWNVVKLSGVPKAERVRIVNEVRLLERLHHPNIISFHGSWVNRETERVIFVTEILSSGTLKSFVQKVQLIRWKIFKRWAIQILKGLEYLHSQDPPIIHRDLKCDNIFINGTSGDLRIGDFGLSTAISKKNQPLSVLGTPEFMAPELYDESYNEKVDIYAFGMLLLEIITRDVPYHECANPAQIYKKVTQGIPPASLRRLKSEDARNFILLCLGIGEDANTRPSATDLMKHEFLDKGADDEATIEVEPAVEDMVIEERCSMTFSDTGSEKSSSGTGKGNDQNNKYGDSIDGHQIPSRGAGAASPSEQVGKPPRPERKPSVSAKSSKSIDSKDASVPAAKSEDDEHGDDHFGEMPENEANMKKVTVLMGRGTTLDDGDPPAQEMEAMSTSPVPATVKASMPRSNSEAETSSLGSNSQFKVAAVEEAFDGAIKPYPDDAINLVLTLPDEAQTRIEFDFDLVNDDPVQVAKEMVTELEEVPDDAVLDISGAISSVARQARIKQNQWSKLQQQQHQQQQQQNALAQQHALQHQQQQQQQGMMMHPQGSVMPPQGMPAQGIPMMPQQHMYGSGYAPQTGSYPNPANAMAQPPGGSLAQPHLAATGNDPSVLGPATTALHQQQSQSQLQPTQPQHNHVSQIPPPPPPQPTPMTTPQIPTQQPPSQMSTPNPQQHQIQHVHQQVPSSPAPMPQASTQQYPPPVQQPTLTRSNSMEISHVSGELNPAQNAVQRPPSAPVPTQQHLPRSISSSSQEMIAPRQLAPPPVTLDTTTTPLPSQQQANIQGQSSSVPQKQQIQMPLHAQPQVVAAPDTSTHVASNTVVQGLRDEVGEADSEEVRRLAQEFEKKMHRAQKSYGTRMDNLHRSKEEAEAQHQMTLEKHEKERVEFEKRVRLAEEEQTRRLNKIQEEFIAKKQEVRQQRVKQTSTGMPPVQNGAADSSRPPLHSGGHKRSSSHFDSSMAAMSKPSPLTDHKRTSSEADMLADSATKTLMEQHQQQTPPAPPRSGGLPPNLPKARQPGSGATPRDRSGSTSS